MSIMTGVLRRHVDKSGVSGTGDVAELAEFSDGAVAVRWHGDHPSTAAWNDIRDVEIVHGHSGATEILFDDNARLVRAYRRVVPFLVTHDSIVALRPVTAAPHPDHPDRLRLTFGGKRPWAFWVALLDGSTYASTHAEVNGEIAHTWITPDGDLWLQYFSPLADDNEATVGDPLHWSDGSEVDPAELDAQADDDDDPLAIFDREDR